jgi:large subunit ribosomal protein L25
MKTYELQAEARDEKGKKVAKMLRRQGMVPCIVYGGKETIHFATNEKEIQKLIFTPEIYKVVINLGKDKITAVLKDIQFHPVSDRILHIDFLEVHPGKPVIMEIPVKLEGFAAGVRDGGKLHLNSRKLKVQGMIDDLQDIFVINVENLALGKTIFVGDLSYDKITLIDSPDRAVASVKLTRVAKEEEKPAEEGAEGAAAEGDAKAEAKPEAKDAKGDKK